jgi:hypothetical protein
MMGRDMGKVCEDSESGGEVMPGIMPSLVVQTIDKLFSHAVENRRNVGLGAGHAALYRGILNLIQGIPSSLIALSSQDYVDFVLATSTIEEQLGNWRSWGPAGDMRHIGGFDTITIIRRLLASCPDEYPPPETTELSFITDEDLRSSIRQDVGASNRALANAEWKATTVLAGAAIEALLLWRLQQPSPGATAVNAAIGNLVAQKKIDRPNKQQDKWDLYQYVVVAEELKLIGETTQKAADLARDFRNLIHPGRAARLKQTCDRGTAYSAVGALEHVIRDMKDGVASAPATPNTAAP